MKLLLDTCTFLWLAEGSRKLGPTATEAFLDEDNERYLSAASAWEIAIKYSRGRMPLPRRPEIYVPQLRRRGNIEMLPVDEEAALYVGKLPWLHQDPFDRVLIAQAVVNGMTILSPDEAIEQYAVRTLW
jgi:PIN domain nuclease of toxin-antitoxin system